MKKLLPALGKLFAQKNTEAETKPPAPKKSGPAAPFEVDPMSIFDVKIVRIHRGDDHGDFASAHCRELNETITISLSGKFGKVWESDIEARPGMRVFVTGVFRTPKGRLRAKRARPV